MADTAHEMATGTTVNFCNQKWKMRWVHDQETGLLSIEKSFAGVDWDGTDTHVQLEGLSELGIYRINQVNRFVGGAALEILEDMTT